MATQHDACKKSLLNLNENIEADRQFPQNVFVGHWEEFLFFESDWMFRPEFVGTIKALLDLEAGTCACLSRLDAQNSASADSQRFFIDRQSTGEAYKDLLHGGSQEIGWLAGMDRFGCISDAGQWCIYAEKRNEVAVIAIRKTALVEHYISLLAEFDVERIEDAVKEPFIYGFSPRALSEEARREFLTEYDGRPPLDAR